MQFLKRRLCIFRSNYHLIAYHSYLSAASPLFLFRPSSLTTLSLSRYFVICSEQTSLLCHCLCLTSILLIGDLDLNLELHNSYMTLTLIGYLIRHHHSASSVKLISEVPDVIPQDHIRRNLPLYTFTCILPLR